MAPKEDSDRMRECETVPIVDVILPVLDEVEAVGWVLERMPTGYRPIVVDNGSSDGSGELARSLGALVVDEPRRGFGSACAAGLDASSSEVVAFMDCDRSLDPRELPRVVDPVLGGRSDLVLGSRRAAPGAWPAHARIANRILVELLRRRTGVRLQDLGPMRAARREDLIALDIQDRRFGWPLEMVLLAGREGMRITEEEVSYLPRVGRSKVTGTVRGTARAVLDMSKAMR
jgi:glycosyltransferase involved in cell wall biosynthesis